MADRGRGSEPGVPNVSVLIPTHQRRELVRRAIASAMAQTYRDFELIVIDDGSTDGTREMLAGLEGLDGRLRYRWQPNGGVAGARNAGLRMARGAIVAFLDSDDRWLPDHLAVVVAALQAHPDALVVSTCPKFVLAGRERPDDARLVDHQGARLLESSTIGFMPCLAIRREAIEAAGGFDERLGAMEDSDLLRRLATRGPFASVKRRTVLAQTSVASLRRRAQASGDYLAAAEISAANLTSAVEGLPARERSALDGLTRGNLHLARAMSALHRGDEPELRAELAQACRLTPLSGRPQSIAHRLRGHQPGFDDPRERLRMLRATVRAWPDPGSLSARYLRVWAIGLATRLGDPGTALRLAVDWPVPGTLTFARELVPVLRRRARRVLQDLRHHERRGGGADAAAPIGAQAMVSVVVPTHQRRRLLRQALKSVAAQTYRDFEVLVIDDGSTDGTREMVEIFDGLEGRLRYEWQPHSGVAAARNRGLRMARGSLVAFLDSDNLWRPNHLQALVAALARHPEAVIAYTRPHRRRGRGAAVRVRSPARGLLIGNMIPLTSGVAVRRQAALDAGGFDEGMAVAEDADLWLRLAVRGGRFASVDALTVIRRSVPGSLVGGRREGDYAAALEVGSERIVTELEQAGGSGPPRRLEAARGRRALALALKAIGDRDPDRARPALTQACRMLPELSERPGQVARHLRFDLPGGAPRAVVAARLLEVARLWPDPGSPTARFLASEGLLELTLAGHPLAARRAAVRLPPALRRSASARLPGVLRYRARDARRRRAEQLRGFVALRGPTVHGQRLVVRGNRLAPLRCAWALAYEGVARAVGAYLVSGTGASAYVKGSVGRGEAVYGVSDVDLAVFVDGPDPRAAARRVRRRWRRLRGAFPRASRALLEPPRIHHAYELRATTLSHGLDAAGDGATAPEPSIREHRRERGGSERPGLYGPGWDWRPLGRRNEAWPLRLWSHPAELQLAAWMELQYWWLQAFRGSADPQAHWLRWLCVKLVAEAARVWLWVAHGERPEGYGRLFERALALIPDEEDALRAALAWRRSLHRPGGAPLGEAVAALTRFSERIAGRLQSDAASAGTTAVALEWGGPDELVSSPEGADRLAALREERAGEPRGPVPLVDWRARTWSVPPDETLVPLVGEPEPGLLARAAWADGAALHPALLRGRLLILPSRKHARLRAAQFPLSDPVSFALLEGRGEATFPELRGWSARDSALRAVAEHLSWLREWPTGAEPGLRSLGKLLSAARAAHFHESLLAGTPQLDLTAAAISRRLAGREEVGAALAERALAELRKAQLEGGPPDARVVASMVDAIRQLPAYADRDETG